MSEPLSAPVLATKFQVPRGRPTHIARPRLLARLDEGFRRPLTLVVAPPGFGKTTLIAQWAAGGEHPVAWLSLDGGDNEPARFWHVVLAALEILRPGLGQAASSATLEGASAADSLERTLAGLINATASLPEDICLVLDDYHTIEDDRTNESLAFLLSHMPAQLHLVMITRSDPLLPLARMRARDDIVELRAADLRFDAHETGLFLQANVEQPLRPEEASALRERTEGWIVGLQLAAFALRTQGASSIADFVAASATTNRFVVDYLVEEVLECLDESLYDFLLQTAVLDRLCASLCNAVTGRDDGQAMLDTLEHINLFLIPLDAQRAWYRYHNLFADVMRKTLQQTSPELVPDLHQRASAWLEDHGLLPDAIHHALAAPDYERAARLIEEAGLAALAQGESGTVLNWLKALPPGVVQARPRLCILEAIAQAAFGNLDAAEPLLVDAERGLAALEPDPVSGELAGQIATVRALLALRSGDAAQAAEFGRRALDLLPESRGILRGVTSWVRGLAFTQSGDAGEADETFAQAIGMSERSGSALATAKSFFVFGLLEMAEAHLGRARDLYERALQALGEPLDDAGRLLAGTVWLSLGEVLRLVDDLDGAWVCLARGQILTARSPYAEPRVRGYLAMAWIRQARGDTTGALADIETTLALARSSAPADLVALVQAHQARLWLAQGDLAAAERWARQRTLNVPFGPGDARPGIRFFERTTWARLLVELDRAAEAITVLNRVRAEMAGGCVHDRLEALVVAALAYRRQGAEAEARAALGQALALAAPQGYVRPFLDEGPALLALLERGVRGGAWQEPAVSAHAAYLLSVGLPAPLGEAAPATGLEPDRGTDAYESQSARLARLVEPLSQRELEVLRLAAHGLGNREIADRLIVSIGTVKSHIHNIFGKLGVQDRAHALEHARELDLI